MNNGWIKIHRKLTEWEWYSDVNTTRVFLHLLIVANHKDKNWRGIEVKRGQRLTSLDKLSAETNLSVSKIRTAVKKLISTNEIASKSHSQHTVFTMINYNEYQSDDKQDSKPVTNESQTNDKQIATNKNVRTKECNKKDNTSLKNDGFAEWWKVYPKKTGKPAAEKSFRAKTKNMGESLFMEFVDNLMLDSQNRYKETDKQFIPNPSTYINQERYNDEH